MGSGHRTDLLAALLAEARRRGCTEVFLEVKADNTRAQRLYHWWGFTEIGIRRGYYQPSGADAIVMRRDLAVEAEPASWRRQRQSGQCRRSGQHRKAGRGEETR